jgi:hypothetical protein
MHTIQPIEWQKIIVIPILLGAVFRGALIYR